MLLASALWLNRVVEAPERRSMVRREDRVPRVSRLGAVATLLAGPASLAWARSQGWSVTSTAGLVAAIPAGQPWSAAAFRAARAEQRETVMLLPLEPLNYPQVNPGPGVLLVTMSGSKIEGLMRKYLGQSGPVAAVANLTGSLATQDQTVMTVVYRVLRERRKEERPARENAASDHPDGEFDGMGRNEDRKHLHGL